MTGGVVVVIGPTGQNFGAGMSGGFAFVHNPDRRLAARTNHQLVDLDPVDADRDAACCRRCSPSTCERTGSDVARELLDRWEEALDEFTLVIPRGYKEATAKLIAAQQADEPADEADAREAAA